jgi:hypothetical protein
MINKEVTPTSKGLRKKTSEEIRGNPKSKIEQARQFTEVGFADPMAECEGDTFYFGRHGMIFITNHTKATPLNEIARRRCPEIHEIAQM